ncbi:mRNA 3'-end-processing protein rna14 [Boothiomyces macroporosus]|uniref:mRNA 3'-end-processing protein rna14 n=1 Tax=Boothiomyces macroporosus TaxID=261099 RepID=A0AAD5Y561_9FUNG|nr:mRNA 3'-end-processing protein rna14 [Boothiomyces macroporosus]
MDQENPEWKPTNQISLNIQQLQLKISKNPWDNEAREQLIRETIKLGDNEQIDQAYRGFLDQFPTCARIWLKYVEHTHSIQDFKKLEEIFKSCIQKVPNVQLYSKYVDYIIEIQSDFETVVSTFEYCLKIVGTDKDSGDLWHKYITYCQQHQTQSSYEDQQKMDQLRKILHRAVHTPLNNIEEIWKEYDTFENQLNKLTAKKFISDQAGGYMTARACSKDLKTLLEPIEKIQPKWIAKPPTWTTNQIQLLNYWKRYLSWEQSNPLGLDKESLIARVLYGYKCCWLMLKYFVEVWYDCACFLRENEKAEEAISILKQGIAENPSSLLLNFTLAEHYEQKKVHFTEIQTLFDSLLKLLEENYQASNEKFDQEKEQLKSLLRENSFMEDDGEAREREREIAKEHEREVYQRIEVPRMKKNEMFKQSVSLVWIVYMRLTRRSQSIKAARIIFGKARKSTLVTSHIYVASALMEYYVNKDAVVAGKIFEAGLKQFPINEDPQAADFISHYIEFLKCLNDDNNTRALFERALSQIPPERSRALWTKYIDYETQYGDLSNLYKIEKRLGEVFPTEDVNSNEWAVKIASKWSYFDISYVGELELGLKHLESVPRIPAPAQSKQVQNTLMRNDQGRQIAMLGGVNVDQYPRPEFGKWNFYRAEPGQAKICKITELDQPASEPVVSTIKKKDLPQVPEAIAKLMEKLPPKDSYSGPYLNVDELVSFLMRLNIPVSLGKMVNAPDRDYKLGMKRPRNDDDGKLIVT